MTYSTMHRRWADPSDPKDLLPISDHLLLKMVYGILSTQENSYLGGGIATHISSDLDWIVLWQIVHGRKLFRWEDADISALRDQTIDL